MWGSAGTEGTEGPTPCLPTLPADPAGQLPREGCCQHPGLGERRASVSRWVTLGAVPLAGHPSLVVDRLLWALGLDGTLPASRCTSVSP